MFAFCAIDFETTGSVPGFPDEPWQVGTVQMPESGDVSAATPFESLLRVSASRPFNRFAPGRHARIRESLAASPSLREVWPRLGPALSGPVVAHNIGTERTLLRAAAPLHAPGPWIDTLRLSRVAWPAAPSHALEDLVPALGLAPRLAAICPGRAPHDALYDAWACALLLLFLLSSPAWGARTPEELAAI